jgi:hypothetical protein
MESIENDDEDAESGRESQDSLLCEAIRLEFSIIECPDCILLFFGASVQRSKI